LVLFLPEPTPNKFVIIGKNLYKDRNKIERLFNRIKHYRRTAIRYDKTAASYLAFVHLAAAMTILL